MNLEEYKEIKRTTQNEIAIQIVQIFEKNNIDYFVEEKVQKEDSIKSCNNIDYVLKVNKKDFEKSLLLIENDFNDGTNNEKLMADVTSNDIQNDRKSKRKYKLTLLSIISFVLSIWMTFQLIDFFNNSTGSGGEAWGGITIISLLALGLFGLFIDYILQILIKNYWTTNIIELLLIFFLIVYIKMYNKEKIVVIPNGFKGYFTIVYGVDNEKPLYNYKWNFGYKVIIPETGILFTSTKLKDDIWSTRIIWESGEELDSSSDTLKFHAHDFENSEFLCNTQKWDYRTWLVNKSNGWNNRDDIDLVTIPKIETYCKAHR